MSKAKQADHPRNGTYRMVFFGDSICVGQGVSIHRGWVARLAAEVERLSQVQGVRVIVDNASSNGNTTRMALERMPYEVQSHGVDVLVVQFGMNDCNRWQTDLGLPRVSEAAFEANLMEIASRAFKFGAVRVIFNTNHPSLRDETRLPHCAITYEEANHRYNEIIRLAVRKLGGDAVLNDVEREFRRRTQGRREALRPYLLQDGLHLSERGHDVYLESIVSPLTEALIAAIARSEDGRTHARRRSR